MCLLESFTVLCPWNTLDRGADHTDPQNLGWTGSSVPFLMLPPHLFQPGNEAGAPYLSACCVPPRVALKEKGRGPLSFPFLLVILDLLPAHSQWAGPLSAPVRCAFLLVPAVLWPFSSLQGVLSLLSD